MHAVHQRWLSRRYMWRGCLCWIFPGRYSRQCERRLETWTRGHRWRRIQTLMKEAKRKRTEKKSNAQTKKLVVRVRLPCAIGITSNDQTRIDLHYRYSTGTHAGPVKFNWLATKCSSSPNLCLFGSKGEPGPIRALSWVRTGVDCTDWGSTRTQPPPQGEGILLRLHLQSLNGNERGKQTDPVNELAVISCSVHSSRPGSGAQSKVLSVLGVSMGLSNR